jgi:hypothetical protein
MPILDQLATAMASGAVEVVDLTARLESTTPVIRLPDPFANTVPFSLREVSRYDDRGPAWYWNDITTGEHTGTHFDAPVHWITGRDGLDVAQVPAASLIAPAVVLDFSAQAAADPDFLLEVTTSGGGRRSTGRCPSGAGCCTAPGGTRARTARRSSSTPARPDRTRRASRWSAPAGLRGSHR